jgi:predicted nucleotidyltransferase
MGISELLHDKRKEVLRIAARHGAHHVRVIGSVARGEARPESDVDFLVDLDSDRSLMDHAALMIELEAFLGRKVDVATERGMRPRIRERVMRDAIPL